MPFRDISGHHRPVALLARAIARQTLPPSLLLAGPQGVGKRRTAIAIAEVLNCLQPRTGIAAVAATGIAAANHLRQGYGGPPKLYAKAEAAALQVNGLQAGGFEIDACGECASCRRIARGVHPDVITLEPGDLGTIKIEQVRDVIDRAAYRPFEGRRRAVIIDEAEAMVPAAQNALLKTLEEPPSASVFVLVSSMPDALLPTVRSRCPRLRFGALTPADVAAALIRDHAYTEAEARAAAADADGSIGRALAAQSVDLTEARAAAQRVLEQTARVVDPVRRLDAAKALLSPVERRLPPLREASADRRGGPPRADRPASTGCRVAKRPDLGGGGQPPRTELQPPRTGPRGAGERDQLAVCLRALASLLRDLGILANRADPRSLANADLQADLGRLTAAFDSERSMRAFTVVDQALGALERNASPKVVADWLVLHL